MKEAYFCNKTSPSGSDFSNKNVCRRNGIDTPNPFNYYTQALPDATFKYPYAGPMDPAYFIIDSGDYCDNAGINCGSTAASGKLFTIRYCNLAADAISPTPPTGKFASGTMVGKALCQAAFQSGSYEFPRYGNGTMTRVSIQPADDTNFANWYAFYRTRILTMKTAAGLAFKAMDASKRVGFMTINGGVTSSNFLAVSDFTAAQKTSFLTKLYAQIPGNSTPLREALSKAGRYFAGKTDGLNSGMITTSQPDPVQYSCQQNFALLSTDGLWNGNNGVKLDSSAMGNMDNVDSGLSARSLGVYDGNLSGSTQTLADVAQYYYVTDLRPAGTKGAGGVDVSANNVFVTTKDTQSQQHMVTYALSMGINGFMSYTADYENGTNIDLENVKKGTLGGCYWSGSSAPCDWPSPGTGSSDNSNLAAVDDLWHATVNGRGHYYSAQNSSDVVQGLQDALGNIMATTASSSAGATSNPLITSSNNVLYASNYRTMKWDGDLKAKVIDPTTGVIAATPLWSARDQLALKVTQNNDSRQLYFMRSGGLSASSLVPFDFNSMNASEKSWFANHGSFLSQYGYFNGAQKNKADDGSLLVGYLRCQSGYEPRNNVSFPLFRNRDYTLGDIVNTAALWMGPPSAAWSDKGYAAFVTANATRTPVVFVASNDGILHAFSAATGDELWGVIPQQVMPGLYKLADSSYGTQHQFFNDGTLTTMDVKDANTGLWRTILVSSLGAAGKGYYALDVTDPLHPTALWESCDNAS